MFRPDLEHLVPPARWPELTLRELVVLFVIFVGLLCVASLAWAQGAVFSEKECRALAYFARTSAQIRDIDASLDKHVALVRRRVAEGGTQLSPVIERELLRVYAEGLAPEAAEQSAYTRCMMGEILRKEG